MSFDYIQIQTEGRFFDFNEKLFTQRKPTAIGVPKKGLNVGEIVKQNNLPPCITNKVMLEVMGNYHVTLGLPATLLGPKYFDLINEKNFDGCLQTLADHGLVEAVDVKGIKESSKVVRLETACDVIASENPKKPDYNRFRAFLRNAYRWKKIEPDFNSFGSVGRKENFKIYGKTREMKLPRHDRFRNTYGITIPDNLVRVEYRLTSAEKVKRNYGSKQLADILQNKDNILASLLDDAFVKIDPSTLYQPKDSKPFRGRLTIAEENEFDLIRIQAIGQEWGKHRAARLRDINQAIISTEESMQRSGNILKEIMELQTLKYQN